MAKSKCYNEQCEPCKRMHILASFFTRQSIKDIICCTRHFIVYTYTCFWCLRKKDNIYVYTIQKLLNYKYIGSTRNRWSNSLSVNLRSLPYIALAATSTGKTKASTWALCSVQRSSPSSAPLLLPPCQIRMYLLLLQHPCDQLRPYCHKKKETVIKKLGILSIFISSFGTFRLEWELMCTLPYVFSGRVQAVTLRFLSSSVRSLFG